MPWRRAAIQFMAKQISSNDSLVIVKFGYLMLAAEPDV
jgi:hypothetical protein